MYDIPNSSYSTKGITENMAAGNQWKHLEFTMALSKRFSVKAENIRIGTSLNILVF